MKPITGPQGTETGDYLLNSARTPGELVTYVRDALDASAAGAAHASRRHRAAYSTLFALGVAACGGDPSAAPDDDDTPPGDRMEDPSPDDDAETVTPSGDGGPDDPDAMPGTPSTPELMIDSYTFTVGPNSPGAEVQGRVDAMTSHVEGQEVDEKGDPQGPVFRVNVEENRFTFVVPPGERCRFRSVAGSGVQSPFTDTVTVNVDSDANPPDLDEDPEDQWLDMGEDPSFAFTDVDTGDLVSIRAYLGGEPMETIPVTGAEFGWEYDADPDENMQGDWSFAGVDRFGNETPAAARRETVRRYNPPVLGEMEFGTESVPSDASTAMLVAVPTTNARGFRVELEITDPEIAAMEGVTAGRVEPSEGTVTSGEPIRFNYFGPDNNMEGVPLRMRIFPKNGAGEEVPGSAIESPELTTGCRISGC